MVFRTVAIFTQESSANKFANTWCSTKYICMYKKKKKICSKKEKAQNNMKIFDIIMILPNQSKTYITYHKYWVPELIWPPYWLILC